MTNRFVLGVLIGALATSCATSVPPGSVGMFNYAGSGIDSHVLKEGLYWHLPWNSILLYPVQWDEREERMHVLTADDVHLEMQLGVAMRPNVKELYALQEDLGVRYYDTIVQSAFFTATRTVFAHYNMVDIPENSEKIEQEIHDHEAEIKIAGEEASIAHIQAESAAATAKISAISDGETSKIRAEGEAKAQELLGKTLTPLFVQLRALTNPTSKYIFVPEGRQLSVVLGEGANGTVH